MFILSNYLYTIYVVFSYIRKIIWHCYYMITYNYIYNIIMLLFRVIVKLYIQLYNYLPLYVMANNNNILLFI